MKVFWMVFHNCIIHPIMGVIELISLGYWMPQWLDFLHEWTASKAGFNDISHDP